MAEGEGLWKSIGTSFKANPIGMVTSGLGAVGNLIGGIVESSRKNKLRKRWNRLMSERPEYEISQGYKDALSTYQRLASGGLPGQEALESNIQQSSARARTAAERGAISSSAYGGAVSSIYDKELQAIQDLGIRAAEYQTSQKEKLAAAQEMMGTQQEKAQDWNKLGAWSTQLNAIESQLGAATTNASNYWQNLQGSLYNFAGTDYYKRMLEQLNK